MQCRITTLAENTAGKPDIIAEWGFCALIEIEGMTVLLVEQNVERSLYVADYAFVLQSGRIVSEGTGTELLRSDMVRKAYLGL